MTKHAIEAALAEAKQIMEVFANIHDSPELLKQ